MKFSPTETEACLRLVHWALEEDLGRAGDLTSESIIPANSLGAVVMVSRAPGVLSGAEAAQLVFNSLDSNLRFEGLASDGADLAPGTAIARVEGSLRTILAAERTALNFVQHLSGVATLTRTYANAVAGTSCRILDTRKTIAGWRLLEKYAVRCGGGRNHRMGLFDGILIKDNHLACLGQKSQTITHAVELGRQARGQSLPLIVEIDGLHQLDEALTAAPDVILLDNMSPDEMAKAVARRNALAPAVQLEASGGVNLNTVRAIAEAGVDRISVGALTHSAPALDIALDYLT